MSKDLLCLDYITSTCRISYISCYSQRLVHIPVDQQDSAGLFHVSQAGILITTPYKLILHSCFYEPEGSIDLYSDTAVILIHLHAKPARRTIYTIKWAKLRKRSWLTTTSAPNAAQQCHGKRYIQLFSSKCLNWAWGLTSEKQDAFPSTSAIWRCLLISAKMWKYDTEKTGASSLFVKMQIFNQSWHFVSYLCFFFVIFSFWALKGRWGRRWLYVEEVSWRFGVLRNSWFFMLLGDMFSLTG